ncbi:lycopene beta-cyclase [Flavobacteriaceae bacterium MAR_2009_75]|nr:lycopene beta-cyclase [Flavobacteriaceae bacterium MAR_2009_75]
MDYYPSHFDYIIIGAGAAGLMLAHAMTNDEYFSEASILILDKDQKKTNDRTWCFWEKGRGQFDQIVHKSWNHIYFEGKELAKRYAITPYSYKMIKGLDFYEKQFETLKNKKNVTIKFEKVLDLSENDAQVSLKTTTNTYTAATVFNSIFSYAAANSQSTYPVIQQHFVGWKIKADRPVFDVDTVTYMDFSVPQKGNTRFMYVLPQSKNEALVEYTLFSKDLLDKEVYEEALHTYITTKLNCPNYEITDREQGSIPMTCYDFAQHNTKRILNIGTAGGWAKPSTGYTFMSTAKKIPVLIDHLKADKPLNSLNFKNRFWYYDLLLLDVLSQNNEMGHHVFESLFNKKTPQSILKFLDEESTFLEELSVIWGCPKWLFIKSLLLRLSKY